MMLLLRKTLPLLAIFILTGFLHSIPSAAQNHIPSCTEDDTFKALDFWIGDWKVYAGDRQVGTNRIEKAVGGCAILEHWKSTRGSEGKSLFYVDPVLKIWKQVWVTQSALRPGGTKEKHQVAVFENGAIRFQGEYMRKGRVIMDRTTLTPVSADSVRQHIQTSTDGGDTWSEGFNAIYVKN